MDSLTIALPSARRRQALGTAVVTVGLLVGLGGCSSTDSEAAAPTAAASSLEGTYALTWSQDDLEDVLMEAFGGADDPAAARDAQDLAAGNAGTIHLVPDAGRYDVIFKDFNDDSCPGTYVVEGDRIVMTATTNPAEWDCGDGLGQTAVDARWTLDEGSLTLTDWTVPNPHSMLGFNALTWGSKPFERVDG